MIASTKDTPSKAKTKWEMKLERVKALVCEAGSSLYDRAKLLRDVYDDQNFIDHYKGDYDKIEEHLNSLLADTAFNIDDMRSTLKHFPDRKSWSLGGVPKLVARAWELDEAERKKNLSPPVARKTPVARKEFERVQKQVDGLREAAKVLQHEVSEKSEQVKSMADEMKALRAENERLRTEIAELRARLAHYEQQEVAAL